MAQKVQVERYRPGLMPETADGLIQFLFDELYRIAAAINTFPVALNVFEDQPGVPVTTVPTEFRLFEGQAAALDIPGGSWDIPLGEWTCPASGLYMINCGVTVSPFGTGNKDYACELIIYVDDVPVLQNATVGDDAFQLGAAIAIGTRITRESVVRATVTLVHEQFVGTTTVNGSMSIISTATS